ncbi:hypothetical protein [Actinomadura macrotermitis]|nr:hypothetical protein [Actinomadura macrotermitis]
MAAHPLLAGGVVHADGHVFLSVVRYGSPAHLVRVAVVMADGAPHYAWHTGEDHGRIIGPADDPVGAVGVLVRVLVGKAGTCPG